MKKSLFVVWVAALMVAACQIEIVEPAESGASYDVLSAQIEQDEETKTTLDESNNVLWSENDQIIAFMKSSWGHQYQIKSSFVGKTYAEFSKISSAGDDEMEWEDIVAYYPYSESIECEKSNGNYVLDVVLPAEQTYEENSFGNGTFPMVAVSQDNNITFRNVCGGVKLQFKGVDKIKSIRLEGLGNEKISGKATVVGYIDGSTPDITMTNSDKSYAHVTLDCGEGVQLSETTPTNFIIAVPPVEFTSGIKITVTDTDGHSRTLINSSANTIKRSWLTRFPVITYKQEDVFELPEEALTSHEIPVGGGTVEIPLTTNQEYEVVIPEDAQEWISVAETKALRNETLILNIAENTTTEDRTAEVIIAGIDGTTLQVITVSQEAGEQPIILVDYIDEYGVNHGKGTMIEGVIWAPVNCGYHETDFRYGKLYQWGRKYGQGYYGDYWYDLDGNIPVETYSDASVPEFVEGPVSLSVGQSKGNENKCYYISGDSYDWCDSQNDKLWNSGTEENPVKTAYDPCPNGWRVPTYAELNMFNNDSPYRTTDEHGRYGYWVSGSSSYNSAAPEIFLPAAGFRSGYKISYFSYDGYAGNRPLDGVYWSSSPYSKPVFLRNSNLMYGNRRVNGYSVRCVQNDLSSDEPEVPSEPETVNLSAEGTANCYTVSNSGSYKFTPTKGNSNESVGLIASAEVLWESFGTDITPNVGDLIKSASYMNGEITFHTAKIYEEGNAVIAAKDASGTILWSWHIWFTDEPQGQVYYRNAGTMMDRNIGATSATPGDVGALGLLYQWGRKDPFLSSSSISSDTLAESTIIWPSAVSSNSNNGTVAYATSHPTTFIGHNSGNYDWCYTDSESIDNTLWTTSGSKKSIYDPCPAGWRVPDGGDNGVWSKALGSSSLYFQYVYDDITKGINFSGKFGSASTIWYPATGYRHCKSGSLMEVGVDGSCWSTSASTYAPHPYFLSINKYGYVWPSDDVAARSFAQSVRCIQETPLD